MMEATASSARPDPSPPKHVIDKTRLESAIIDMRGDTLLLELALEDIGRGDAWEIMGRAPRRGYKLYLLTNDQVRALLYAQSRVMVSAAAVAIAFWGRDLASRV